MKKTIVALALATAATGAFATGKNPNKDCYESPQYPHGTPACKTPTQPPVQPPQQNQGQNQGQGQQQGQDQHQGQQQSAEARARAEAEARANAQLTDNSRTEQTSQQTNQQTNQQTTQQANNQQLTDQSQNNSAATGNKVNVIDNSRTTYRAAPNRAAPDGGNVLANGCWDGVTLSGGVGTMDVNVGGSVGFKSWSKDSVKCGEHEQKMKQIDADISREASLRASDNPVDNALAHEQAKASSDAYKAGDAALSARVNTLTENGAKPLDINQNDGHKLMGYGAINIRKPVVTTVTPPSAGTACAPIVNVYLQAAQAARSTGKVAKVETPKVDTTCKLEVEQALKNAGVAAPKP